MGRRQSVICILSLVLAEHIRRKVASDRSHERLFQASDICGRAFSHRNQDLCF